MDSCPALARVSVSQSPHWEGVPFAHGNNYMNEALLLAVSCPYLTSHTLTGASCISCLIKVLIALRSWPQSPLPGDPAMTCGEGIHLTGLGAGHGVSSQWTSVVLVTVRMDSSRL